MTSFGPNLVFLCPHCFAYLYKSQLRSFSSYKPFCWSDGYGSFSLARPFLFRCPDCKDFFRLSESKEKGEMPFLSDSFEGHQCKPARLSEEGDFYDALKSVSPLSEGEERSLRIEAYHASNQPERHIQIGASKHQKQTAQPLGKPAVNQVTALRIKDNRKRLLTLLSDDCPGDLFYKVEIARREEEFSVAEAILDRLEPASRYQIAMKAQLKAAILRKDSRLFEFALQEVTESIWEEIAAPLQV